MITYREIIKNKLKNISIGKTIDVNKGDIEYTSKGNKMFLFVDSQ